MYYFTIYLGIDYLFLLHDPHYNISSVNNTLLYYLSARNPLPVYATKNASITRSTTLFVLIIVFYILEREKLYWLFLTIINKVFFFLKNKKD